MQIRSKNALTVVGTSLLLTCALLERDAPRRFEQDTLPLTPTNLSTRREALGRLPLSFEANRGQTDPSVGFLARGPGYTVFLTPTETVLSLKNRPPQRSVDPKGARRRTRVDSLRMRLVGASNTAQMVGLEQESGRSNYFVGSDQAHWISDIPRYRRIRYHEVYAGIDIVYYGHGRQLEYDLIVAPYADSRSITLGFEQVKRLSIDQTGELVLTLNGGEVHQRRPMMWQEIDGTRQDVVGGYVLRSDSQVGFEVGAYDRSRPLVIDPILSYSTYLGGSDDDLGADITLDAGGNVYVTGETQSANFPKVGALQGTFNVGTCGSPAAPCSEVFVSKLNAAGNALVYSTYLGGASDDSGKSIAVDSTGAVYVAGDTESTNFPTTNGAFQRTFGGTIFDAFVAKLSPAGSALVYSTYLGGNQNDLAQGIAVDGGGNAYVTGSTFSTNFPTKNPVQATFGGRVFDVFVTKVSPDGSMLVYSTYLGGGSSDEGQGIAVDSAGNACVTGFTFSTQFPTSNALQPSKVGTNDDFADVFVSKLTPAGVFTYSTYLGGSNDDYAQGVAIDATGNCYLTGMTLSANFPTANAIQAQPGGGTYDAFITKVNSAGSALVYSTYLGGGGYEQGFGIAVDATGAAVVVGTTGSNDFPTTNPFQPAFAGGLGYFIGRDLDGGFSFSFITVLTDVFITKLNPAGSARVYSTYLGGSGDELAYAVAVDGADNAYLTGETSSANFPTANALQSAFGGGAIFKRDAFISRIDGSLTIATAPSLAIAAESCSPGNNTVDPGETVSVSLPLTNLGTRPTSSLVATLLATGGVSNPSGPQNYGAIAPGGAAVSQSFTFTANGQCGGTVRATFQLQDGAFSLGSRTFDLLLGVPTGPPAFSLSGPPVTIADLTTIEVPITVSDVGMVSDVNVKVRINHSFDGDLDLFLVGPDGTTVELSTGNGGSGDNYGSGSNDCTGTFTAFDDAATTTIIGAFAPFAGTFRPEAPLTAFNGKPSSGQWKLRVIDDSSGDTGALGCWQLEINKGFSCCAPVSLVTSVSAASFQGPQLAVDSIAVAFGQSLATTTLAGATIPLPTELAGTRVKVKDSVGTERPAQLFFVSSGQVNYVIPSGSAIGAATVTVVSGSGAIGAGAVQIVAVAPGIFTANSDGQGVPAAQILRVKPGGVQSYEQLLQYDQMQTKYVPLPIDLGPPEDEVFLVLFGTGIRFRSSLSGVSLNIGGMNADALYADTAPGYVGLDQVNTRLARGLIGKGLIDVGMSVDGKPANTVKIQVK